jgi:hypothetical protein
MAFSWRRWTGPGISFLFATGLQLSDIRNVWLAVALWTVAAGWGLIAAVTSEPITAYLWRAVGRRHPMWVIGLSGVLGFALFAGGAFFLIRQSQTTAQTSTLAPQAPPSIPSGVAHKTDSADVQFVVECRQGQPPRVYPPEGRILIMAPMKLKEERSGSGILELFGEPGSPAKRPAVNTVLSYRCEVVCYAPMPVFDAAITFNLVFHEGEFHKGAVIQKGQPGVFSRTWTFRIPHIAPQGRVAFYAFNNAVPEAIVMTANEVSYKTSVDGEVRTAKVTMTGLFAEQIVLTPASPSPPPVTKPSRQVNLDEPPHAKEGTTGPDKAEPLAPTGARPQGDATAQAGRPLVPHIRYTSAPTVSMSDAAPYGLQVVLQTDAPVTGLSFKLTFNGPIRMADFRYTTARRPGMETSNLQMAFKQIDGNTFSFGFASPAFIPEEPIIAVVFSAAEVAVLKLEIQ